MRNDALRNPLMTKYLQLTHIFYILTQYLYVNFIRSIYEKLHNHST